MTFFAVREQIAQKLEQFVTDSDVKKVYTPNNSLQVTENQQVTPSLHVNYAGLGDIDARSSGKVNALTKRYSVSVACRNEASQRDNGLALDEQLGELTNKVIKTLSGFYSEDALEPLKLIAVRESYSLGGFAYTTIIFEVKELVR